MRISDWSSDVCSSDLFWTAICSGTFDMDVFDQFLSELPSDKRKLKAHMLALAALPVGEHEAELYPVLQACSFGGKQIWRNGNRWANACFRDFWQPTATSIRRSPANPMRSEEHTSDLQSLMRSSYAVFCLK